MSSNWTRHRPALPTSSQSQTLDLIMTLWALCQGAKNHVREERGGDVLWCCDDLLPVLLGSATRRLWGIGGKEGR